MTSESPSTCIKHSILYHGVCVLLKARAGLVLTPCRPYEGQQNKVSCRLCSCHPYSSLSDSVGGPFVGFVILQRIPLLSSKTGWQKSQELLLPYGLVIRALSDMQNSHLCLVLQPNYLKLPFRQHPCWLEGAWEFILNSSTSVEHEKVSSF